ncbi:MULTISPECIES: hypothetical protein [Sphingobacterium]|uniref:hypothetical protein n=1 Tax=Sphingobacterium TaxID=28453 RepID=UPI0013DADF6A|nr:MULTISPECIES: hypothetical protein [unclassified Sphingobacterium]
MLKKKFLLLAPNTFNLYELIVENLEFLGYEVTHIENEGYLFRYRSLWQRFCNLVHKTFYNNGEYKARLREEYVLNQQIEILDKVEKYDYSLVIRADLFDKELIKKVRAKTDKLLSFHFDGISRDRSILEYIPLFDQFYVFDPADVLSFPNHNLFYSPNFYFDYPELLIDIETETKVSHVYYVSSHHLSREQHLIDVHKYLSNKFKSVNFIVVCQEKNLGFVSAYIKKHMTILHEHVNFEEQIRQIRRSDIIIDLVISDHKGYSFRIFEGIKYGKKVVTTNPTVVEADFYHPNNFFVLTNDNWEELDRFLDSPLVQLDEGVRAKYAFSDWLNSKLEAALLLAK